MSAKRGGSELSVIVPLEVEFIFWRPPLVRITFFYLDSHRKKNIFYSTLSNCLSNCTWWTAFGFNLSCSDRRHNMSLLLLKDNYELMSNLKIDWLLNSISGMSFFPNFILKTSSKAGLGSRSRSRSEPGVFGSLEPEPEPLEKKNEEP